MPEEKKDVFEEAMLIVSSSNGVDIEHLVQLWPKMKTGEQRLLTMMLVANMVKKIDAMRGKMDRVWGMVTVALVLSSVALALAAGGTVTIALVTGAISATVGGLIRIALG